VSDQSQKTEKPTPHRLKQAREEGRFAVSAQLLGALQMGTGAWLVVKLFPDALNLLIGSMRSFLVSAFEDESFFALWAVFVRHGLMPAGVLCLILFPLLLAAQLGMTQLGINSKGLTPSLNRLNPFSKLGKLPKENLTQAAMGLAALLLCFVALWFLLQPVWGMLGVLPMMGFHGALRFSGATLERLLWHLSALGLLVGMLDYLRRRREWSNELKMSQQDIRDEHKQMEGSPETKMRIRRLQREMGRRRMMAEVPKASAVIVNPTHYAVAVRYEMTSMAAPKVVAKGVDHLAYRIRQTAIKHEVPVIENPPLARALYASAQVGQEIPPHLYKAVAEVLAWVFRTLQQRR
jgi:flagellar biosynthesis protein FlhB